MNRAIFIIGPSRSGTSVLAEALGKHPEIFATEELHYYNLLKPLASRSEHPEQFLSNRLELIQYEKSFFKIKNEKNPDVPGTSKHAVRPTGGSPLSSFFDRLARENDSSSIVEQTPMNLYYLEEILEDFPEALFVLMRRDPRAIIASQKSRWSVGQHGRRFHPTSDLKRFKSAGHPFIQMLLLRKTLKVASTASERPQVHAVVYEELVRRPADELNKVSKFLGIEFADEMTEVSDKGSSHTTETGQKGFDATRLDSWREKLTPTEIWLIELLFGYHLILPNTNSRPSFLGLAYLLLTFPRDLLRAAYYSSKSYGNIFDAIKRRFI